MFIESLHGDTTAAVSLVWARASRRCWYYAITQNFFIWTRQKRLGLRLRRIGCRHMPRASTSWNNTRSGGTLSSFILGLLRTYEGNQVHNILCVVVMLICFFVMLHVQWTSSFAERKKNCTLYSPFINQSQSTIRTKTFCQQAKGREPRKTMSVYSHHPPEVLAYKERRCSTASSQTNLVGREIQWNVWWKFLLWFQDTQLHTVRCIFR